MPSAAEIRNPAWDVWCRVYGPKIETFNQNMRWRLDLDRLNESLNKHLDDFENGYHVRSVVIDLMTFAVPSPNVLDAIVSLGKPIVEMGAGTGYWAWCLRQLGVDVVAYDKFPPQTNPKPDEEWITTQLPNGKSEMRREIRTALNANNWFRSYWTEVKRGRPPTVIKHPDRALLMVWPYMDDMAVRTLRYYTGDTLIYVGEERAACATDEFFDEVEKNWEKVADLAIPQWPGLHDEAWILKRRAAPKKGYKQPTVSLR